MKKPKRTKVTVTMTFSLLPAKVWKGRVAFKVGCWTYYAETPKQARTLIINELRKMVSDP